jgi:hypothetical protein
MEPKAWDEIRDKLKEIDVARLTPLEALKIISAAEVQIHIGLTANSRSELERP